MKRIAVVYKSKYGSTKKYAQWIAEELSCDLYEREAIRTEDLNDYDIIIYGGGLYAGGVSGIDLITKSPDIFKDKKVIIFTCGLADTTDENNTSHIREGLNKILPQQLKGYVRIFHLRGAIDYSQLGIVHKAMMEMLHKSLLKKDVESLKQEDKEMLETYGKKVDFTDRASINNIISYARGL